MARPVDSLTFVLVLYGALSGARAAEAAITIDHQGVGCVVAGKFPAFRAHLSPAEEVARARIDFHAEGDTHWYFVEMKLVETEFVGVLPQPLTATKKIHYYIEVIDKGLMEARTAEYEPIVAGAGECGNKVVVAAIVASAKVPVGSATPGAPLVLGFSAGGVVPVGATEAASGPAAGTAAGTAAAAGGGLSGAAIAGIAVAGAGAVGVVVVAGKAARQARLLRRTRVRSWDSRRFLCPREWRDSPVPLG